MSKDSDSDSTPQKAWGIQGCLSRYQMSRHSFHAMRKQLNIPSPGRGCPFPVRHLFQMDLAWILAKLEIRQYEKFLSIWRTCLSFPESSRLLAMQEKILQEYEIDFIEMLKASPLRESIPGTKILEKYEEQKSEQQEAGNSDVSD